MSYSVPREVNGLWYPVPCPEGAPLSLGFPTELACVSFCEAVAPMHEAWEAEWAKRETEMFDEMSKAETAAHDSGYDAGFLEGGDDGYDRGFAEGYDKHADEIRRRVGALLPPA